MARVCKRSTVWFVVAIALVITPSTSQAQLSSTFYDSSCPGLQSTVSSGLSSALSSDGRVGASILRLHFHDCFVQGCDASVLLADTSNFTGEQGAAPNVNSLRGFPTVDQIKASVESQCSGVVSCADLLALLARDAVVAAGGPSWTVLFGRRDSTTASLSLANSNLPSPNSNVAQLTSSFSNQGLSQTDMVALSGAHTFGKAQCSSFNNRLFNFNGPNTSDPSLNPSYLSTLQGECPQSGSSSTTVNLDQNTPTTFDNAYYTNLPNGQGLLESDQALQTEGGNTASLVGTFAGSQNQFFAQFVTSIINMGNINLLTGSAGEIRTTCSAVNSG